MMDRKAGKSRFGQRLRDLRHQRGLTLKQVVAASREIANDSAGYISHPYLSQLERNIVRRISLPKLITLSTLYGVHAADLAKDAAPGEDRRLLAELTESRKQGRFIPDPLISYRPPSVRDPVDQQVDVLLADRAQKVSIPLKYESIARILGRDLMLRAAVPAYLQGRGSASLRLFWAGHEDLISRIHQRPAQLKSTNWFDTVEEFLAWLLYDHTDPARLFIPVARWSFDFESLLAACHFTDPDAERRFGFDGVPWRLLSGVSWRMLAMQLAADAPARLHPFLPPAPRLLDAAGDYIKDLIAPERIIADPLEPPPATVAVSAAFDLAQELPELLGPPSADQTIQRAAIAFLRAAQSNADSWRPRAARHRTPKRKPG